jgi:hypothetical protein
MKTIRLTLVLFTAIIGKINAQNFYINISSGIQLPTSKSNSGMFSSGNLNIDIENNYTYKTLPVSFAQGKLFTFSAGYKLKKTLGFEVQYGQYNSDEFTVSWIDPFSTSNSTIYSKTWNINPSIVFFANQNQPSPILKNIYGKVGFCFGSGIIFRENSYIKKDEEIENYWNHEIAVKQQLGVTTAIGSSYPIYKNLLINTEITLTSATLITQSLTTTSFISNGIDARSSMSISELEVIYSDEFTRNPNNVDPNQPSKSSRSYYSFNGVALKIGLQYAF